MNNPMVYAKKYIIYSFSIFLLLVLLGIGLFLISYDGGFDKHFNVEDMKHNFSKNESDFIDTYYNLNQISEILSAQDSSWESIACDASHKKYFLLNIHHCCLDSLSSYKFEVKDKKLFFTSEQKTCLKNLGIETKCIDSLYNSILHTHCIYVQKHNLNTKMIFTLYVATWFSYQYIIHKEPLEADSCITASSTPFGSRVEILID